VGLPAALSNALADMALRNLGRTDDALTTVFYFLSPAIRSIPSRGISVEIRGR
jgi:hypothetical protein